MRIKKEEFERTADKYSDAIFRCAYSYCGNKSDAEDVVQETFIKYLKKSPTFKDETQEKAWLLRVAINLCKDLKKSYWYKNRSDLDDNIVDASAALKQTDIWDCINRLPPKYRIVIELYFNEGYKICEIAKIIGAKQSTVGSRLTKAKQMLSEALKED